MPIIEPADKSVKSFEGLHLYHAGLSNCSIRARIALEEKGLPWKSHLIDLMTRENTKQAYFDINPNGLVPTLIDNGVVIIDSADIIDHLDNTYDPGSLRPETEDDMKAMYRWMYLARDNHLHVKTYMYTHVLGPAWKKSPEELANYQAMQKADPQLLAFHQRFAAPEGFSDEDVAASEAVLLKCFEDVDARLADHEWLVAGKYTLADIAWIPQVVNLSLSMFPFDDYKNVMRWKQAIRQRPAFRAAIEKWIEPGILEKAGFA